jgi:hypothetical protein
LQNLHDSMYLVAPNIYIRGLIFLLTEVMVLNQGTNYFLGQSVNKQRNPYSAPNTRNFLSKRRDYYENVREQNDERNL